MCLNRGMETQPPLKSNSHGWVTDNMVGELLTAKFLRLPPKESLTATSRVRSPWSVLNQGEQERASGRGSDGGWWIVGWQPLLSASIRKPRGDMGAGQDTRNPGEGGGGRRGRDRGGSP